MNIALANFKKHCADPKHPYDQVVRYRHKNGSTVWVRCRGIVIRDEDGKPVRMLGAHNDLTKEKQAEEQLKLERYQLKSIFDTIPAVIDIVDLATNEIVFMNKYTMDLYGSDGTGKKCYEVFHNFKNPCSFCNNRELIRKGFNEIIKWEYFSDTLNRSFMTTNRLLKWSDGRAVKLELSIDVSDLKKIQNEKNILQTKLQQAQKMESIGSLAGGIAHDFNNILSPIIGLSEMLAEDISPDSPEHKNVLEILKAGIRGSELVKQILAFSRQSENRKLPVRIQQVLKEVLRLIRSTIPADINIIDNLQKDCGVVIADPVQLHQIAMNLITNAYHAVEQEENGEISVFLTEKSITAEDTLRFQIPPGKYAELVVADNGCGIKSELMDKIFEPYFTTKEQGKGTGLGLAVVYGIVKEHHGDIEVYSEIGKGTKFTIYFPLTKKTDIIEEINQEEHPVSGDERLLIVDDEKPIVRLEKQILERLGYRVTEKFCSSDALETFRATPDAYDLNYYRHGYARYDGS